MRRVRDRPTDPAPRVHIFGRRLGKSAKPWCSLLPILLAEIAVGGPSPAGHCSMGKKNFYAVKVGRAVGIFLSWAECEAQVKGHPGAIFKGFASRPEAEAFLGGAQPTAGPTIAQPAAAPTAVPAAKKPRPCTSAGGATGSASMPSSAFSTMMAASGTVKGVGVRQGEIAIFTDVSPVGFEPTRPRPCRLGLQHATQDCMASVDVGLDPTGDRARALATKTWRRR